MSIPELSHLAFFKPQDPGRLALIVLRVLRNLPATQLQVAMGIPLDRMPQIRSFYGASKCGHGTGPTGRATVAGKVGLP